MILHQFTNQRHQIHSDRIPCTSRVQLSGRKSIYSVQFIGFFRGHFDICIAINLSVQHSEQDGFK